MGSRCQCLLLQRRHTDGQMHMKRCSITQIITHIIHSDCINLNFPQQCKRVPVSPFSSVQFSHSVVSDSATLRTAAHQASLSITSSRSPPKPMSIQLVMPSNHFILCCPLLLLPSIFPSIRVFSSESASCIRWPK